VKMRTLLDLRGNIPSFVHVSDGKPHDVNVLDLPHPEPAAVYVMDRAHLDCERLSTLRQAGAFFVTRAKSNADLRRVYSAPNDRPRGIVRDQTVALSGFYSRKRYPLHLRRIRFKDPEIGKNLIFLTDLFDTPPMTICELYKARWQIELFFKWIKQHLRIKKFHGTPVNAAETQIWVAVGVCALVVIVKKRLDLDASPHTLLQIFSVTLFEKTALEKGFPGNDHTPENDMDAKQLKLFEF